MTPDLNRIYVGDCLNVLRSWPDGFVQTVVTSPPYWGLRDYGVPEQLGLEPTPEAYAAKMVEVFREVRRVLRDDGTLWLNLGDSYAQNGSGPQGESQCWRPSNDAKHNRGRKKQFGGGLKPKDLVGIPWRVAFALQADGWYLRSDIIWAKPNPMPESVTDRPTKAHEYLFLLAKSERYYYDAEAIKEPAVEGVLRDGFCGGMGAYVNQNGPQDNGNVRRESKKRGEFNGKTEALDGRNAFRAITDYRNKRSVWTVATMPFSEAHFATFPPALIKPCILAGSKQNDIVFDPFMGAGTTALVASTYGRHFLGIELNPDYAVMAERRIANELAQVKMAV